MFFQGLFAAGSLNESEPAGDAPGVAGDVIIGAAVLELDLGPEVDVGGHAGTLDPEVAEAVLAELGPEGDVGEAVVGSPKDELTPLETVCNSRVRRVGDMVGGAAVLGTCKGAHANTYTMDSAIKEAFLYKRHQQRAVGTVDIDCSHRELEGVCSIAALAQEDHRNSLRDYVHHAASSLEPLVFLCLPVL